MVERFKAFADIIMDTGKMPRCGSGCMRQSEMVWLLPYLTRFDWSWLFHFELYLTLCQSQSQITIQKIFFSVFVKTLK